MLRSGLSILFCVLAFGAYLLPNHTPPWLAFHSDALIGVAYIALFIEVFFRGVSVSLPVVISGLLFSVVPLLQFTFGLIPFFGASFLSSLYLFGFFCCVLVGIGLVGLRLDELFRRFFGVLLFSAIFSVGVSLYQWFSLSSLGYLVLDLWDGGRPFGNLGQPNQLATLLFAGTVGLIMLYEDFFIGKFAFWLALLFLSFGVVLTQSRVGVLQQLMLVLMLACFCKRLKLRVALLDLIIWIGVLAGEVLSFKWVGLLLGLSLHFQRGVMDRMYAGTRPQHWKMFIDAILQAPIFGYGFDRVSVAHYEVANRHVGVAEWQEHAHNIFLDLCLWMGLPVAVVLGLGFLVILAISCFRLDSPRVLLVWIGVLGFLLHAMFEFPLEYAYFLFPFGVMFGFLIACTFTLPGRPVSLRWMTVFVVVQISLLFVVCFEYFSIEREYRQLRYRSAGFDVEVVEVGEVHVLTQMGGLLKVMQMPVEAGVAVERLRFVADVVKRYSYPDILLKGAVVFGVNGWRKESAEALQVLCKRYPEGICEAALSQWRQRWVSRYEELKSIELPIMSSRSP